MKRILTLVVAVLCSAVVFAQANYSQHLMSGNTNRTKVSTKIEKPNKTREGELWQCTFEEAEALYTTGQIITSQGNWELQTLSASDGGQHYWALNYTSDDPSTIHSETPDHWMLMDGDGRAAANGNVYSYDADSYMLFTGIDLTEAENPQIGFWEYRRLSNMPTDMEATTVEVSLNGGASWTTHVVGCEAFAEHSFGYRRVPIFEARGHENVMIRFRAKRTLDVMIATFGNMTWNEAFPFYLVWQVDDIVIEEAQAFDLVVTDVRMNRGRCDYYSNPEAIEAGYNSQHYQLRPMFGQTPLSEWTSENMFASFNVAVENRGSENVTPMVNIKITAPNGDEVWTVDFEGEEVGPYGRDTIDVIEFVGTDGIDKVFFFNEEQMQNILTGEYTVTYTVSTEAGEDPTPANNTASHPFYITADTYSPATPNITTTTGPTGWGGFQEGGEIIIPFEYYVLPDEEIKVYVYIDAETNPGTAVAANIYEYDAATDDLQLTNTSGTYTISESDLGQWININFETSIYLDEFDPESVSKDIYVGIACFKNGLEKLYLGGSNDMPNKGWICRYDLDGTGMGGINVTNDAAAPAIALGTVTPATTIATSEDSEITMYPNPSNGIVNFTNVENATIEVYNMMGQVVASESNVSENASIDLSGVANGNYIVRIVKNGEIATSKLNIVK